MSNEVLIVMIEAKGNISSLLKEKLPPNFQCKHATTWAASRPFLGGDKISFLVIDEDLAVDGNKVLKQLQNERMLQQLQQRHPGIRMVFLSFDDSPQKIQEVLNIGATRLIKKDDKAAQNLIDYCRVSQSQLTGYEGMKVMVVDDSSLARDAVSRSLSVLGVDIIEFDDGLPAYEYLMQNKDNVDLILLDNTLKKMHGKEVCYKLRYELGCTRLPVIFLSGSTEEANVAAFFRYGASDHLPKPFLYEEFIARVTAHLELQKRQK